jgi:predicted DsbA family dithiol-disulfide isomerase
MSAAMRIDIYSDTVCPWCFLAKRRLELALLQRSQYVADVNWRAFELNPDLPPEGVDRAWFIATRVGDPDRFAEMQGTLTGLGADVGIQFRFDLIQRVPNTRRSHLLIAHARRFGLQSAVKDRLMRAYFEEGCDIGELDELVRLGAEAGLQPGPARTALVVRAGQDGVVAAERHAAGLGLTGVPAFIFDGQYTISGAQEIATLVQVFDQVAEMAAARELRAP